MKKGSKRGIKQAPVNPQITEYIKTIENRTERIEKTMSNFVKNEDIKEIKNIREELSALNDRVKAVEDYPIVPPLASLSKKASNKIQELEKEIKEMRADMKIESQETAETNREFEKQFNKIQKAAQKTAELGEKNENNLQKIMNDVEQLELLKEVLDGLDMKAIMTEIESIKQKNQWIEERLEKLSVEPFYEKIQEMEHKMNLLKVSSPHIIE